MDIAITKSSRHPKITGDFGEALVIYWLSKYGFECGRFDHTGIDIVALNPHTHQTMGISVKSRSRNAGKESDALLIGRGDLRKAQAACDPFKWVPYFAIVVDAHPLIRCFILSLEHLASKFPTHLVTLNWSMSSQNISGYREDPKIAVLEMQTMVLNWWGSDPSGM